LRSIELLDLLLKYNENAAWRVAGLELGGKWVGKKVLLGAPFICFQGIIEDWMEIRGRCGNRVSVRHNGGSEEVRGFVGDGNREVGTVFARPPRYG
jgi:hypothetical protein